MCRWRCFLLSMLVAAALASADAANAQELPVPAVSPPPAAEPPADDAAGAREVGPTIFYVWDEKSKRAKAILSTSLEDLQELEALRAKPADEAGPQSYHFSPGGATVMGSADSKRADVTIALGIETRDEGWIKVPLRLQGAILQHANLTGPGSHFIEYDDTLGHIVWIRPSAKEAKYQLELRVLAPLSQVGEENRLDLKLPRLAPIKMSLTVATPNAKGAVATGSQVTATTEVGEGTRFDVQSSTSDLKLAWQGAREPSMMERPAAFDAVGEILVIVDSPTRIVWEASFDITAQQGELAGVSVRLPPGSTLVNQEPAARSAMVEAVPKRANELVEVEFERPLVKGASRNVRLVCERIVPPRDGQTLTGIEVGGFEVIGAAAQRGFVGMVLGDTWRCDATPGNNTLRNDALPDGFREAGVLGSDVYQYVAKGYSLVVNISPRRKKLTLAPTYLLDVQADRVVLDARLKYQVLGARTDSCRVDLPDWKVEAVELVQSSPQGETREPIDFDPFATMPLAINLPRTMRGEFEVRIRARQDRQIDTVDLAVKLPRPAADEREGAVVVVLAANQLELNYLAERSRGLTKLDAPAPIQLPPRQLSPLVFREELNELDPSFAAEIKTHSREVAIDSLTLTEIGETSISTRQRLDYTVRYEALTTILVEAPSWLQQHDSLRIALDGVTLPTTATTFMPGDQANADVVLMRINLPQPMIGTFACEIRHDVAVSQLESQVATNVIVPVFAPHDGEAKLRQNRVEVQAPAQIRVETNDPLWRVRESVSPTSSRLVLDAIGSASQVELVTTVNELRPQRATMAEKVWLQTWIAGRERHERAVYQIRTNNDRLILNCPPSMRSDQLVLIVDGVAVVPRWSAPQQLLVSLEPDETAAKAAEKLSTHCIELWWPIAESSSASVRLAPPQIEEAWVGQVFWHVVLPRDRMSLGTPAHMSPEMAWSGPWWQSPRLSQAQLESWSGATAQDAPPSKLLGSGYRQYLFSSIGQPVELSLSTQPAAWWMLGVSGIALLAALAIVYFPNLRRGYLLFAAAAILLALAWWWPSLGVFAAHCAAAALAVFVATKILENVLTRWRAARFPAQRVASLPAVRRRRAVEVNAEPSISRPSTTATAAMSLPLAADVKP